MLFDVRLHWLGSAHRPLLILTFPIFIDPGADATVLAVKLFTRFTVIANIFEVKF